MPTPRYIAARPSVLLAALGACVLILAFSLTGYVVHAQGQDVTATAVATGNSPPAQPGCPTAVVRHDSVTLTWAESSDDTVTHYAVPRRNRTNAGPELSYTNSTVEADSSYGYRVKAVSPTGVSRWSGYVNADTPAAPDPASLAPSGLSAAPAHDSGVALSWDAPEEDAGSVTGYEVLRAQGEADLTTLAADTGSADTAYTDATATEAGETYAYRVRALRGEEKSQAFNRTAAVIPKITREDGDPPVAPQQNAMPAALDLSTGNNNAYGMWSDETTIWVADSGDDKLYAYVLIPGPTFGNRDSGKDITLAADSTDAAQDNGNPTGMWSDETTIWVADDRDNKLYTYALPRTATGAVITGTAQVGQALTAELQPSEPAAVLVQEGTNVVPQNWSLIPAGVAPGQPFRLLFLTHTGYAASSSNIAAYNAYVQSQATPATPTRTSRPIAPASMCWAARRPWTPGTTRRRPTPLPTRACRSTG